jgi:hypothetical protein
MKNVPASQPSTPAAKPARSTPSPASDGLVNFDLSEEHHARLTEIARKQGVDVSSVVCAAVEKHLVRLESSDHATGDLFASLTVLEERIFLLRTAGDELIARVGDLVLSLDEDEVNAVTFFFRPMLKAFGEQLVEAFSDVHRLTVGIKEGKSAPADSGAADSSATATATHAAHEGGITFKHLSALERAVMGFSAFADGIKAQLGELISRTGDDGVFNDFHDQLNELFWNLDHGFGLVQKNADEHVSDLFTAWRKESESRDRRTTAPASPASTVAA